MAGPISRSPMQPRPSGSKASLGTDLAHLDLQGVTASEMTAEQASIFEAARPTARELAMDRWMADAIA